MCKYITRGTKKYSLLYYYAHAAHIIFIYYTLYCFDEAAAVSPGDVLCFADTAAVYDARAYIINGPKGLRFDKCGEL